MNPTHPGKSELEEAAEAVRSTGFRGAALGIVLGSGLSGFANALEGGGCLPYDRIPHMPLVGVAGHVGELAFGELAGVPLLCLRGRAHAYEGHPPSQVVFGVRLLAELECRAVLLTNAAGGLQVGLEPGDFLLVTDHLNLTGMNPLAEPGVFPRFVDMSHAYDKELCGAGRRAANTLGIALREGVYAGVLGPSYETPAEIRMLRTVGADAVGMSTVAEVIALRQRGVRVAALSLITNLAAGIATTPLDHGEVEREAKRRQSRFLELMRGWIEEIVRSGAC
jgi:purine-nucleoside phosphorylase